MRLQSMRFPDSLDTRRTQANFGSHTPCTPMGGIKRLLFQSAFHHFPHFAVFNLLFTARTTTVVEQPFDPIRLVASPPTSDGWNRRAKLWHYLTGGYTNGTQQDDTGSARQLLWSLSISYNAFQFNPIFFRYDH